MDNNRNQYLKLLSEADVDEGLVKYLVDSGFFEAPATAKYYYSYYSGLCDYSLKITQNILNLSSIFNINISRKTLLRLGLLSQVSKSDLYELTSVNKKIYSPDGSKYDELGNFYWQSELGYKVKDVKDRLSFGNYGFNSYMITKNWVNYTDEEIIALSNYTNITNINDNQEVLSLLDKYPALVLLHMAIISASYIGG